MLIKVLVLTFLWGASSETATSVSSAIDVEESQPQSKLQWSGEMSLESLRREQGPRRSQTQPGIQNFSLAAKYSFSSDLQGYFELLGEQDSGETSVYIGQVFADWEVPLVQGLKVSLGNMYYSYGVLTGKEGLLASRPDYYQDLLISRRGIDLGGSVQWQVFNKVPISVGYSYFSGKTLRAGDGKLEEAKIDPQYVTLSYQPSFLNAQATFLNRQYESQPRFEAFGLSVETKEFRIWRDRLRLQGLGEIWHLSYIRQDGLSRNADTQMVGSLVEFFHVYHRWLYSLEKWQSHQSLGATTKSDFQLHGLGVRINEHFRIEYQNIQGFERQDALSLNTKNEEAWRIYLKL